MSPSVEVFWQMRISGYVLWLTVHIYLHVLTLTLTSILIFNLAFTYVLSSHLPSSSPIWIRYLALPVEDDWTNASPVTTRTFRRNVAFLAYGMLYAVFTAYRIQNTPSYRWRSIDRDSGGEVTRTQPKQLQKCNEALSEFAIFCVSTQGFL
jgi:hypothetical protein